MCRIVCVQNHDNLINRGDDDLIDDLARAGIAYVPFFPLGGFSPIQSPGAVRDRPAPGRHAAANRIGLAVSPLAEYFADPRHLFRGSFAGKSGGA